MPDDLLALIPAPEPHPALVAAMRPSPADVCAAAAQLGWFPDVPVFSPAVPA